jgi:hypothetical protein
MMVISMSGQEWTCSSLKWAIEDDVWYSSLHSL